MSLPRDRFCGNSQPAVGLALNSDPEDVFSPAPSGASREDNLMNKLQKRLANVAAGGALVLSGAAGAWTMTGIAGAQDTTAATATTATTAAAQPGETSTKASDGTQTADDKASEDKTTDDKTTDDKTTDGKPEGCPGPGEEGGRPRPPHPDNGMTEEELSGDQAEKVTAAVEAKLPGATIERMETDAEAGAFEAHVTDADGKHLTVTLDKDYKVTGTEEGPGPRPQRGS
ncbi:hypothetical protein [Candidatus Neomicrothrix sp.]|uniref:hypothetical protein n=1 Tax=Candidatus Neomicrothrix sp. TaxID=2719034 RepID=UPI00259A9B5A|nr:hypothetical protein [Candidatus Microthrix sp.]HMS46673.1 hypothetical protein [Candidatus Microthrix sp.]